MVTHNITVCPNEKNLARRSISLKVAFVDSVQNNDKINITVRHQMSKMSVTLVELDGETLKIKAAKKTMKNGTDIYVLQY